jgi:recombination protein RecR
LESRAYSKKDVRVSTKIPALDFLIHELGRLPGIGEKTAQRLAYFILKQGPEFSKSLQESLSGVQTSVHPCPECFAYTDQELKCHICASTNRDEHMLCIVEDPADITKVEKAAVFKGRYHVLQGAIAPLDNVGPDDLRIKELIARIDKGLEGKGPKIEEVILALDADLEGDTTALYISKVLSAKSLKLTRIAYGVPFGSDIDYIDQRTLGRALENRVEI